MLNSSIILLICSGETAMKKLILYPALAAFLITGAANAQIVLKPDVTGSMWGPCCCGINSYEKTLMQVGCCRTCISGFSDSLQNNMMGVVMFYIRGQSALDDLTQNNFTAKLENLEPVNPCPLSVVLIIKAAFL